jgi:hypothetical protein
VDVIKSYNQKTTLTKRSGSHSNISLYALIIRSSRGKLRNDKEACTDDRALLSGRNKVNGSGWETQDNYSIELAGICCHFHPFSIGRHHNCRLCESVLQMVNKEGERVYLVVIIEADFPPYRSSIIRQWKI